MQATLYWFPLSHPAQAVRKMLDLKGIEVRDAAVLPGMQLIHLRLAGFRGGTVPAVKLDGRRAQGSRSIARALDRLVPEPPLFPTDPKLADRVEAAERWGEQEFQDVPRIILRWGLTQDLSLRRWMTEDAGMPLPQLTARATLPVARLYARRINADAEAARRSVVSLRSMLARVDELLADGTAATDPPNAAALQLLSTVRALDQFSDFHDHVSEHSCVHPARALFPDSPGPVPRFVPEEWLEPALASR